MSMNKQTVWLVSMLTLMVVLSAYYMVTGPIEPTNQLVEGEDLATNGSEVKVDIKPLEQATEAPTAQEANLPKQSGDDYFVAYQLQRNTLRQKMTEEYMNVLTDPKASKEQLAEAEEKIEQLVKVDNAESVLEELIRKEGFPDAVVVSNNPNVDVVVQSKKLSNEQAVKLITLVKQQLNVSSNQISVTYRQ
ncbi:SpoIIIAH-like family protein [Hazenella sp. IB182357]|uniref:SpoIIIAH-like family protein n=1 Tax=Polycladospora coralii TaxID=2771432 RepID=A0A926NCE3_9BACL|nr:SpoIIIAH-like family protein [Polycladospora coralii]MBD1373240.1 SpoIIIAH-like family protein [Polycladospora coralii]MBS7530898.1 SpoIIIAH-like family protein [Polycladospora coralii]